MPWVRFGTATSQPISCVVMNFAIGANSALMIASNAPTASFAIPPVTPPRRPPEPAERTHVDRPDGQRPRRRRGGGEEQQHHGQHRCAEEEQLPAAARHAARPALPGPGWRGRVLLDLAPHGPVASGLPVS